MYIRTNISPTCQPYLISFNFWWEISGAHVIKKQDSDPSKQIMLNRVHLSVQCRYSSNTADAVSINVPV